MNIFNIPSRFNFLESLHDFVIDRVDNNLALSNITVLLPSRRSCNELKRIFLENSKNGAIILPNIKAVGDIDYDDLMLKKLSLEDFENNKNFSANTSRIKYKILLIKELLKWTKSSNKDLFKDITIEQASNLALELEKFLNEVNKNGLELSGLEKIVDDEYSQHWQEVLNFLEVFGEKWDKFIEENNIVSIVDFKTKMIEFNSKYFEDNKPLNPIIVAGIYGGTKSICDFVKSIVKYDNCFFIFNGLDKNLTEEEWEKITVFHPQYAFKKLLDNCICEKRNKIKDLCFEKNILVSQNLEKILSYSMLPYNETYKWQDRLNISDNDFSNISKIECKNNFEELSIISLITKYFNEKKYGSIAIIVSDGIFADQLEVELKNMNLTVNNVFGNKISRTEIVKFLFLILDVLKSDYETIALLSLLKHVFTLFGYDKDKLNELTLLLEDEVLRSGGQLNKAGILKKIKQSKYSKELGEFFKNITSKLDIFKCKGENFNEILKNHLRLAEEIASNDSINGYEIFWNNDKNGNELLNFFNEVINESEAYGKVKDCSEYSYLLDYLIAENSYSDKFYIHPMINIISPQEARLLNYDLVIIANLNDGKFPPFISTDPWMSKSMRKSFGLPDKEELIGNYAYDFTQHLHNKKVILTRALKEDGVPTTKSKYLMRLETFLLCQGLKIKQNNIWLEVYKKINEIEETKIIKRPKPTPSMEDRPKKLYATAIERLMNNPYDIYADKILKLKKKDDFYENKVFAFFGTAVHGAIELYIKNYSKDSKENLYKKLVEYGKQTFDENFMDESSKELFFIRFLNIARWFVNQDEMIRNDGYEVFAEQEKSRYFDDLDFTLSAKIDRIEKNNAGLINIADYKTGTVPSESNVLKAKKPQLVIEAIILENEKVDKLAYWSIKGKGEESINFIKANTSELVSKGKIGVKKLISYFRIFENSYIATTYDLNDENHHASDYKHLSRVDEWGYL